MKEYLVIRRKQENLARISGVILSAVITVGGMLVCGFNGFKYLYPPPEENSFVIDFTEETPPEPVKDLLGEQPRSEEIDRTRPIDLVQRSESPFQTTAETSPTPASSPDDFGDVDTPVPEQEPVLDPRASFPGMARKDTSITSPHSAQEATDNFKAGQPSGNTVKGKVDGAPNAHLKGRKEIGTLPRPRYSIQQEGTVVVEIRVDQYGNVTEAIPGADGTTVTDKTLWNEARKAAMESHFSQDFNAPIKQVGTITYIFKLK